MSVQPLIGMEAAEYARHGWPLVLLPPNSKGEHGMRKHWNARQNAATNPELVARWHGNVGLLLAFAGVASIDIDDLDGATAWLEARGVNLMHLLAAHDAVRIDSGRPGRAKLLYRVPESVDAESLLTQRIHGDDKAVILELRCAGRGGVSMQDVLPPSIHPDTGQPYRWKGDWRKLPELPAVLLAVWMDQWQDTVADVYPRPPVANVGGPAFQDMVAKLDALGCKPFIVRPGEARSHCPVHRGESGTTLHINEAADGRPLLHCHAGCDWRDVFNSVGFGPAEPVRMSAAAPKQAPDGPDACPGPDVLPPIPDALCALPEVLLTLPGRMGEVQDWLLSIMYKPHAGVAGLLAIALVDYIGLRTTRIASRGGLALADWFLVLAPTAFGKETLRTAFRKVSEFAAREGIDLSPLHFSAPSSEQGLQKTLLDAGGTIAMLPDEFGDWMFKGEKDQHRGRAMAHMMTIYGNPFGVVQPPASLSSSKLGPVRNPRMVLFGTSTGRRFMEVINGSVADSGFLNRFVILPVGNDKVEIGEENDDPLAYEIPPALQALVKRIGGGAQTLVFDDDASEYKKAHLRAVIEPIAERDTRLGGRLNEQAMRIAAALALNDGRCVIELLDMARGYEIRQALYERTAEYFGAEMVLSDDNPTMRAMEQLKAVLKKHKSIPRSHLVNYSRQLRALHIREQQEVIRALIINGFAYENGGRLCLA